MRTQGSDDLYRLIHSLTAEEKAVFKKFATRHSTSANLHVQLFDAIVRQKEFEETSLKKKFNGYKDMKGYLFDMVLDSTVPATMNNDLKGWLHKKWFHLSLLSKKGMQSKVYQLALRAEKTANDAELFYLEEIFSKIVHNCRINICKSIPEVEEVNRQFFEATRLLRQKQMEEEFFFEMNHRVTNADLAALENNLPQGNIPSLLETLLQSPPTKSCNAERLRLLALAVCYDMLDDEENCYKTAHDIFEMEKKLWSNNHLLKNFNKYSVGIQTAVRSALRLNKFAEAFAINKERQHIQSKLPLDNDLNTILHVLHHAYIYFNSGSYQEGEKFISANFPNTVFKRIGTNFMLHQVELYAYKLLFEFMNHNYKQVFKTLAQMQSLGIRKTFPFYYKTSELIKILLQIELAQYELLPSLVNNYQKQFAKKTSATEKEMLQLVRKINATNTKQHLQQMLQLLKQAPEPLMLFSVLELKSWLMLMRQAKP